MTSPSPAPLPAATGPAERLEALIRIPAGPDAERVVAGVLDEARRALPGRAVSAAPLSPRPDGAPSSRLAAAGALPGLVEWHGTPARRPAPGWVAPVAPAIPATGSGSSSNRSWTRASTT